MINSLFLLLVPHAATPAVDLPTKKYLNLAAVKTMVAAAEAEARKRGIRNVYLDTFSFQAPGFYKKLGYREFGKLKDFPPGHTRHWMTKAL